MILRSLPCFCLLLQAQLEAEGGADEEGLQMDAAQLAEYRKLKGEADAKTSRLLQDRATLEAQLKVCDCMRL